MWLSQIARASSNTKFVQKVKVNPAVARNQTAVIENNQAINPGQTAVINSQGFVVGYQDNSAPRPTGTTPTTRLTYVDPTITYGSGQGERVVQNPQEFLEQQATVYTAQAPGDAGNEYVFTNGIDFGLEIKY